jgi:hypothetical protein
MDNPDTRSARLSRACDGGCAAGNTGLFRARPKSRFRQDGNTRDVTREPWRRVAERPGFCRFPRSAGPALCIIARCMHYIISRIPIYPGTVRRQLLRSTALLQLSTGFLGCDRSRELTASLLSYITTPCTYIDVSARELHRKSDPRHTGN